ncbi:MAG: non-hydrolyzing UDP-N-acetylglucosamine 2-epimerase [Bacillota bacterium]|uniref:non-hydrolyzing UDP-N-acetylglucosamine 2-epimerase n=1 Tax=Virgibacillus sp. AGTR TaxID=2812055 RepID=UPI001965EFE2|nr:UDP-N-acetylglucosamine 2-epimerase (non-hydrolyzing) [Virgibacillus sp. AGTR]MCC2251288.1 UDP-N-acetylglucosamine 2-epimerase (non-hydrolyzing) [Virgibacillus sp. AGTR]QRZ19475.1 UDP-N-acetylglucosamine 2-epimerase (non-hydrolyzing) [Virgibacillus sp. AGTR]
MHILTIVGARPQFIKASMLSKAINSQSKIKEIMVHTGQHYDDNMSTIFFDQLKLAKPDYYLGIGSGSHGEQTSKMLLELEKIMMSVKPDIVLVYGDTNSTLAGSIAAAKLHIPLAHVEAGLRSFNKKMPEEINRVITDHLSTLLFCPTQTAINNLKHEGINRGVYLTGDIMYDSILYFKDHAIQQSTILEDLSLTNNNYYLATVHRAENTDQPEHLKQILTAFQQLAKTVVLPLHPRTKSKIKQYKLNELIDLPHIKTVEPLHYFDMLALTAQATAVLTDSGGLQKEAYMLQIPCITLRQETEWIETVQTGWNQLAGYNTKQIVNNVRNLKTPNHSPPRFGDGKAAYAIHHILMNDF